MLTKRYMSSVKNVPAIMRKIVEGTAPEKFTYAHLEGIGFKSSADKTIIPIMKDLGFLTPDGSPTKRYHDYRDPSRSKYVMAEALHDAYTDLFHINEKPGPADKKSIEGKFKSTHNVTDRVAELQTMTFYSLLALADLDNSNKPLPKQSEAKPDETVNQDNHSPQTDKYVKTSVNLNGLHYNIQIHLPATKDVEVFNAIFKSLKEHLID